MYEKMWNGKKNRNSYICDVKKMWCVLDYLLEIWQTAVMRFRLLQHWNKKVFVALEIAERPSEKFQGKNQSQIFDQIVSVVLRWAKPKNHRAKISHKKYRWFCGERNQKTTEPKFSIKSIGGFTVSDTEKPPQRKKKVSVVLPLTKPINDSKILSVVYRWLRLTTHIGDFIGRYRFTNGERTHRWFFYGYLRWFGLLGSLWIFFSIMLTIGLW